MRTRLLTAFLAAGAVSLTACGDRGDHPLGLAVARTPGGSVIIQVSDSTGTSTPVYHWNGGQARELAVTRVGDGFQMWRVEAVDLDQGFGGPVQHGETPFGGRVTQTASFLTDSVEYQVRITTVDGSEGRFRFRP